MITSAELVAPITTSLSQHLFKPMPATSTRQITRAWTYMKRAATKISIAFVVMLSGLHAHSYADGCSCQSVPCECSQSGLCRCGRAIRTGLPNIISGVDSAQCRQCGEPGWTARGPIPWELFAQGEYIGPSRLPHVAKYMLRVDDQLELSYRLTRETDSNPYRLTPGDIVHVESTSNANYEKKRELAEFVDGVVRNLEVQPDGTITLPLIGRVPAAGRTTDELRDDLDRRFKKFYKDPSITVTPIKVNSRLEDLRAVVDSRQGLVGGQAIRVVVTPDGTVQLPGIGSVPAQGLMLDELKREIDARYAELLNGHGIEVTPVLSQRAPRFIYVLGEVTNSGRFDMVGPTNVMQAIALAGGWQNGGNLRHIIVFRRADDWRLMATKIDIRGSLYGKRPIPTDNIWLRDSDVVLVTKQPIKTVADGIDLIFTQGIYAVLPILGDANLFVDGNN